MRWQLQAWRNVAAYRRVYDSRHLQADCQEPGSAPEPYAQSVIDYWFLFTGNGQPKDRHCASCIGTLSFPIVSAAGNPRYAIGRRLDKKTLPPPPPPGARSPVMSVYTEFRSRMHAALKITSSVTARRPFVSLPASVCDANRRLSLRRRLQRP